MSKKGEIGLDRPGMERVLLEEEVGCLCLSEGPDPYGVPVSYAYLDGAVVIHCALSGRKLDVIRSNPRAGFVVSRHPDPMRPHRAEDGCTYRFESVLCFGKARVVEDPAEKMRLLGGFKAHFYRKLGKDPALDPVTGDAAAKTGCVVVEIESMTGRKKG